MITLYVITLSGYHVFKYRLFIWNSLYLWGHFFGLVLCRRFFHFSLAANFSSYDFQCRLFWPLGENKPSNIAKFYIIYFWSIQRDEVVLSKTVLSKIRPKQSDEWIGGPRASLFQLFFAFLTWPNLTCLNRPLSPFFHHLAPPGWPLIWRFFSKFWKMDMERRWGRIIELFLAFLTWPNLTCWSIPLIPSFIT